MSMIDNIIPVSIALVQTYRHQIEINTTPEWVEIP